MTLRLFGFAVVRRPRGRLTEARRLELEIERAYQCGARYSRRHWRRRPPPRMGRLRISEPGYEHQLDQRRAFTRGYDDFTRARIAHHRRWAEPWLEASEMSRAA